MPPMASLLSPWCPSPSEDTRPGAPFVSKWHRFKHSTVGPLNLCRRYASSRCSPPSSRVVKQQEQVGSSGPGNPLGPTLHYANANSDQGRGETLRLASCFETHAMQRPDWKKLNVERKGESMKLDQDGKDAIPASLFDFWCQDRPDAQRMKSGSE